MLAPAYDLLSTKLVMPEDNEELALSLCGKKKKLRREHFTSAMAASGLQSKVVDRIFAKYDKALPKMRQLIDNSFLPIEMQSRFIEIIEANLNALKS